MDEKGLRRPPQGWTLDVLADHLLSVVTRLLAEMDKRYDERFIAQKDAIAVALINAKEAVTKAETAVEKRFDNTNEWRAAMQDRDRDQMPRVEIEQRLDALANSIKWAVGIMVTLLLGLAATVVAVIKK